MRTEVFIAYTKDTLLRELKDTLEAWDTDEYEPVAIEVPFRKYEQMREIAAEGMSKGDYIIADLGSSPHQPKASWTLCKKGQNPRLRVTPHVVQ